MNKELEKQISEIITSADPNRHTFFQLNFFVLGKEPTHQAKLKKCVDELRLRKKEMDSITMEIEDLKDKNEILNIDINKLPSHYSEVQARMINRRIEANNKSMDDYISRARVIEEESIFFVQAFKKLSEIEPMKQWDDTAVQTE